jgi:hypothetical protein
MTGIAPETLQALCHFVHAGSEKRVKAGAGASHSQSYITMAE